MGGDRSPNQVGEPSVGDFALSPLAGPGRGLSLSTGRLLALIAMVGVALVGCANVKPSVPLRVNAADSRFAVSLTHQVVNEASGHDFALENLTTTDLSRISTLLPGPKTVITVTVGNPDQILAPVGVSGFTDPETGAITVGLYPFWTDEPSTLTSGLARTLAREVDRSVRITSGAGLGKSLLDQLVTDGIASAFGQFAFPGPPDPWVGALSAGQECQQWRLIQPVLRRDGFHGEVLSGGSVSRALFGESTMPALTGQTIGYDIVSDYLARNPGKSWSVLARTPSRDILRGSGYAPCSTS